MMNTPQPAQNNELLELTTARREMLAIMIEQRLNQLSKEITSEFRDLAKKIKKEKIKIKLFGIYTKFKSEKLLPLKLKQSYKQFKNNEVEDDDIFAQFERMFCVFYGVQAKQTKNLLGNSFKLPKKSRLEKFEYVQYCQEKIVLIQQIAVLNEHIIAKEMLLVSEKVFSVFEKLKTLMNFKTIFLKFIQFFELIEQLNEEDFHYLVKNTQFTQLFNDSDLNNDDELKEMEVFFKEVKNKIENSINNSEKGIEEAEKEINTIKMNTKYIKEGWLQYKEKRLQERKLTEEEIMKFENVLEYLSILTKLITQPMEKGIEQARIMQSKMALFISIMENDLLEPMQQINEKTKKIEFRLNGVINDVH